MLNKIAYFLFFLMVLLAACGDSGSSSFEELEQGADVDSSADGTDLSSGALSSGGKMSSSSSSAWSKKDTLFYIDKICYNRVDGQHSLQVRFKTDIAQTNDVYVYSFYNFSGMKEGRSCGFSVTTSYVYLTDSVSEKGWFNVNLELKDMNLYSDRESETPGVADFHVIFLKPVAEDIHYIKVPIGYKTEINECFEVDSLVTLSDTAKITKFRRYDYSDSSSMAKADTFPTLDSLKKAGCYDTERYCQGRRTHYIDELSKYIYCYSGTCSDEPVSYPEVSDYVMPAEMPIEGSFTDPRDGTVYPTVTIGMNVWFAKNLNYADSVKYPNLAGHSWCYNNDEMYCDKFGRLYDWAGALNLPEAYNDSALKRMEWYQGICPEGWHVSTAEEFSNIWQYSSPLVSYDWIYVARDANIWDNLKMTEHNNKTGFSAMPGGYRTENGEYKGVGQETTILVTGMVDAIVDDRSPSSNNLWRIKNTDTNGFNEGGSKKRAASYIRCVKGVGIADARPYVVQSP